MTQAQSGNTVKIKYNLKLQEDNKLIDESTNNQTMELKLGENKVIPMLEDAIVGMSPGDAKTVSIPSDQAFGAHKQDLVVDIDRNQFPQDTQPQVGQQVTLTHEDGNTTKLTVTDFSDEKVTLDANHPMAGKDMTFEIELLEIA